MRRGCGEGVGERDDAGRGRGVGDGVLGAGTGASRVALLGCTGDRPGGPWTASCWASGGTVASIAATGGSAPPSLGASSWCGRSAGWEADSGEKVTSAPGPPSDGCRSSAAAPTAASALACGSAQGPGSAGVGWGSVAGACPGSGKGSRPGGGAAAGEGGTLPCRSAIHAACIAASAAAGSLPNFASSMVGSTSAKC